MKMFWVVLISLILLLPISCTQYTQNASQNSTHLYAEYPANVRLLLKDKPKKEIKSVFVNVKQFEFILQGVANGRNARVVLGNNFGPIDLLTLQNGTLLPIQDMNIPEGIMIKQIRLVLHGSGNYLIDNNNEICDLQTPSAQQSGIKINLKQPIFFENNYNYSLIVDFDANKSIVIKGNEGCLLKPVLKFASATRIPMPPENDPVVDPGDEEGQVQPVEENSDEEQLVDGNDENPTDWDDTNENDLPPIIPEDALSGIL